MDDEHSPEQGENHNVLLQKFLFRKIKIRKINQKIEFNNAGFKGLRKSFSAQSTTSGLQERCKDGQRSKKTATNGFQGETTALTEKP